MPPRNPGPDYVVDERTGCWQWIRTKPGGNGYAEIRENGGRAYAHRVYYERHRGSIPEGLVIDHLCRNPLCVNPAHMEVVANGENVRRGDGPPARNARKDRCPRGHPYTGANVRRRPDGARRCRACDREDHAARAARRGASS